MYVDFFSWHYAFTFFSKDGEQRALIRGWEGWMDRAQASRVGISRGGDRAVAPPHVGAVAPSLVLALRKRVFTYDEFDILAAHLVGG